MLCALSNNCALVWEQFAKMCRTEKDDVVWDVLTQKAKVMASVERACAGKDADIVSSEDILKRLFLNAESAHQQVKYPSSSLLEPSSTEN